MTEPNRDELRKLLLSGHPRGTERYLTDPLFHATVELAALMLDVVNDVAGPELMGEVAEQLGQRMDQDDAGPLREQALHDLRSTATGIFRAGAG